MRRLFLTLPVLALSAATAFAQAPAKTAAKPSSATQSAAVRKDLVEFGMMTWPEVKAAIAAGKTTALVYTGGTEQRGPQNVNGGHTLMGHEIVKAIALKLGNAIFLPVLPYTPNNASADLPGTIGLTPEILAVVLERISEQAIATGFKNVIIMGDPAAGSRQPTPRWRPSSRPSTRRRGNTSTSATRSTRRHKATSTSGCRRKAIRSARTPASPTPRRCSISAATRAGCVRS